MNSRRRRSDRSANQARSACPGKHSWAKASANLRGGSSIMHWRGCQVLTRGSNERSGNQLNASQTAQDTAGTRHWRGLGCDSKPTAGALKLGHITPPKLILLVAASDFAKPAKSRVLSSVERVWTTLSNATSNSRPLFGHRQGQEPGLRLCRMTHGLLSHRAFVEDGLGCTRASSDPSTRELLHDACSFGHARLDRETGCAGCAVGSAGATSHWIPGLVCRSDRHCIACGRRHLPND